MPDEADCNYCDCMQACKYLYRKKRDKIDDRYYGSEYKRQEKYDKAKYRLEKCRARCS